MPNLAVAPNKAATVKRHPVLIDKHKKKEHLDRKAFVEAWRPKTGIIEIVKNTPRNQPLVYTIQPDEAMDLLTLNDFDLNREFSEPNADHLEGEFSNNDFKYTGDTVKVSVTNRLMDGQHRLWACWVTKVPFETIIATGIPDENSSNMDLGKKRSAADTIAIGGYKSHNKALANAIKNILLYKKKSQIRSSVSDMLVSVPEVKHFMIENKKEMVRLGRDIIQAQDEWMRTAKNFFTLSQWLVLNYILRTLPGQEKAAAEFMRLFSTVANLKANSPIYVAHIYFRNGFDQFIKGKDRKTIERNILSLKFNCAIEAWNLWQKNEKVTQINLDPLAREITKPYYTKN